MRTAVVDPRAEWLKVDYAREVPRVVGCILPATQSGWICFRTTRNTAYHTKYDSPCGIDVGTLRYLDGCPWVTAFAVHLRGSGQIYRTPMAALLDAARADRFVRTHSLTSGQIRTRLFLPVGHWDLIRVEEPYHVMQVPHADETRIAVDGTVLWRTSSGSTIST